MARAYRHYIPNQVWHLTHRCHKREFLLKFAKDRHRWMKWLYEARKRFGLVILNYVVTSNHVHLVAYDKDGNETIPRAIQLIAGRTGQEYNQRKNRKGAFWQDRYHATAIETGNHLLKCLVYIDLNMVRAGVVSHPVQWDQGGYKEIQQPRRKNILINYETLSTLCGFNHYEDFQTAHRKWVQSVLTKDKFERDDRWSRSIATGSASFIESIKKKMGAMAIGRRPKKKVESYELRDPVSTYNAVFDVEKGEIDGINLRFWQ